MVRYLTSLLAVTVALSTGPAFAQDTTPATSGDGLDLGQPVEDGTPQQGERYLKQEYGDWSLACIKTEAETDPCSLLQILTDADGNSVAEVSLFRLEGAGQAVAAATVIVPLETLLPAQLTIKVDAAKGKRYQYNFCNQVGCYAQIGLTQEDVDAFKRGSVATVSLVPAPAPDQTVDLNMSLSGFTAGYDAVDVVAN
ncbi:invasion associated locus B family protein [Chachezhania antarctica]|uniref:invasion associated locus B family protein n=1 Tax=Chachezhania antarctica TaxID=2340860 RepID=UPI000EB08C51|nr:invasion associated locus B family protein [Chachezhania antarctica]